MKNVQRSGGSSENASKRLPKSSQKLEKFQPGDSSAQLKKKNLAGFGQTCTNTRNTIISPGVLGFQVVFVNKFNLMEDMLLMLFWRVSEGLDLISCR